MTKNFLKSLVGLTGEPIFWHLPEERSGGSLPDSFKLWDILWKHRRNLSGFAHSHPGSGFPAPSMIDLTTFSAIERGLGKSLDWWITSYDSLILVKLPKMEYSKEVLNYISVDTVFQPPWVTELREKSEYKPFTKTGEKNG